MPYIYDASKATFNKIPSNQSVDVAKIVTIHKTELSPFWKFLIKIFYYSAFTVALGTPIYFAAHHPASSNSGCLSPLPWPRTGDMPACGFSVPN